VVLCVLCVKIRWTGGYIFANEWQSFRTRQNREHLRQRHDDPGAGQRRL